MELQHIKDTKCPHCNASIRSEGRANQHTNGHWNEYREFVCGYRLEFSPNYMQIKETSKCRRCAAFKEELERNQAALSKLLKYIQRLDVSLGYKEKLVEQFKYVR